MIQTDLNNQTMKQLLKRFSNSELFVLSEAAHYLKVSENYLAELIKQGKLKAFKVDNHWFVEEAWLLDYKKAVRQKLLLETDNHLSLKHQKKPWTKSIIKPEIKTGGLRWYSPLAWLAQSAVLAVILIGAAYLVIPFAQVYNQKQLLASLFLAGVNRVYSLPLELVLTRPAYGAINDEALTRKLTEMLDRN